MARNLPILAVQATSRTGEAGLDAFESELEALLSDFPQTKLVVYPEIHLCGVSGTPQERGAALVEAAQPLEGPRIERLSAVARRLGVWLMPGTVCESAGGGKVYNTAPVFSPQGELAATYRKCFPWRPFEPYVPGNAFTVFDIPDIGRVGLAICYDIWFPEVARQLAWMGAEVILNPAQTSTCDREKEKTLVQANAIFNQVFVVSINAAAPAGTGQSLIADPEGNVRVSLPSESPAIMTDVLNLEEVERVRRFGTCGLNRMWAQFGKEDAPLALPLYNGAIDPRTWGGR